MSAGAALPLTVFQRVENEEPFDFDQPKYPDSCFGMSVFGKTSTRGCCFFCIECCILDRDNLEKGAAMSAAGDLSFNALEAAATGRLGAGSAAEEPRRAAFSAASASQTEVMGWPPRAAAGRVAKATSTHFVARRILQDGAQLELSYA
mmetsp:Transcript_21356/g.40896  ORF Transcript_21356/g.40896 Transcript_21356/m.40896 type:complete len:148 (+) Transcript_21356:518-961(+)